MIRSKKQILILFFIFLFILFVSIIASVALGSVDVSIEEILATLFQDYEGDYYQIIVNIRLPRIAFALVAGLSLAVSGLLLQVVLRNPMADSGSLGISAGASFATSLVMLVIPVSSELIPIISFVGGMGAFLLILSISWERDLTPTRLILTGAALNAILRGGQSFLMTMYSDRLQGVITWQNGNLAGKSWNQFYLYCAYILPVLIIVFLFTKYINVLNLSDATSYSLGVPVRRYRVIVACLGVYLAAVTVSQVGMIGFVGLLVPHMVKALVGANAKKTLPFTILLGSILLLLADLFSRIIAPPLEIPIGTVMSIIGGPFFLYLVARKSRGMR